MYQFAILKIRAYDKQIKPKKFKNKLINMNTYFKIEMNLDIRHNFTNCNK